MQEKHKRRSIQNKILLTFTLVLLVSALGIAALVLVRWYRSSQRTIHLIESTISKQVQENVVTFLHAPMQLNAMSQRLFAYDLVSLSDETARDRFFIGGLLSSHDAIYSFSYGTEEGHYYGARRNKDGVVEIMRNNETTQGRSWYYSVQEDGRAGERVVQAGLFDPRTRAWYQAAKEKGVPAFSPIYKHFIMDDLTISAAWPVYRQDGTLDGVFGTHMLLTKLGDYLEEIIRPYEGYALIVEQETGLLVGNSMQLDNFTQKSEGGVERTHLENLPYTFFYEVFRDAKQLEYSKISDKSEFGRFHVRIQHLNVEGVNWVLMTAVPHSLLFSSLYSSIGITILLVAIAGLLSFLSYRLLTKKMLRPLDSLLDVADAILKGNLDRRVQIVRNDEIGLISEYLNRVSDKMRNLINHLEENVQLRTEDLNEANEQLEESRSQLRLLLDSTAEGIYGMDLQGRCTFINKSALHILGYEDENQFLGQNIHAMIHLNSFDGANDAINDS